MAYKKGGTNVVPPFNFCGHPYVGIIQIRLWVKAYASSQPT